MLLRWKTLINTTLAVVIGITLVAAVALAQDGRKSKITAGKASQSAAGKVSQSAAGKAFQSAANNVNAFPFPPTPPKPTWVGWRVEALPTVEGKQRDYHLTLAKALSRMNFVPDERIGHFRALDTPQYRLDGWHGFIESATQTPNGAVVELRVTPIVTSTLGASTTVASNVFERYEVTNGGMRYLGTRIPADGAAILAVIVD